MTAATPAVQRQQLAEAGIAVGGATAIGGFLLAPWLQRCWLLIVFALAGAGSIGVGLAPVEVSPRTHEWLAVVAFLGFEVAPFV